MIKLFGKKNEEIHSLSDWLIFAAPAKKEAHLKDLRSAMELAKCWFRDGVATVPLELQALFNANEITKDIVISKGYPERETKLDNFGKGRNHDLVLLGEAGTERFLISIEAKADESYGKVVGEYLKTVSARSNVPNRIEQLTSSILGTNSSNHLRYQLLHAIAGTLIEAREFGAKQAIFLVHEFHSNETNDRNIARNNHDLNAFLSELFEQPINLEPNLLLGPVAVNGGEFLPVDIPLYVGRVVRELPS
ncbi:DUF6946 family protein [Sutcliffiella horikoshii]|uniref:DUF6946 family protein n=1 Tax=Sutcliffiella horikoshii TaxID=79883 RepID=UPI001F2DC218|nr:hypothetical protein [Sutcliffiella horikoshii]MCG1023463.1 hypothetical protein [Sutcliffiella horikoshii]